jgi:hypothetical protein
MIVFRDMVVPYSPLAHPSMPPLDARLSGRFAMAVDGKWEIVINSPLGAQKAQLDLAANGATLTGTQQAAQGSGPLENGKVDGSSLSWSAKITSPMPMTLDFSGTVEGDKLTGSVKAGSFGSFPFTGTRLA